MTQRLHPRPVLKGTRAALTRVADIIPRARRGSMVRARMEPIIARAILRVTVALRDRREAGRGRAWLRMDSHYGLHEGDCLKILPDLPAGSVDLVLTDLPYGVTDCDWDQVLNLVLLWEQLRRVGKRNAAYLFTATLPFGADLIQSNRKWFRYDLVWDMVNRHTGYGNCNKMPLRRHELILVFYAALPTYNPQMGKGGRYFAQRPTGKAGIYQNGGLGPIDTDNDGSRYPNSIIAFESDIKSEMGHHPTQKPISLLAYLIQTYSNPGDTVLDCCMGSGSTGVACLETGRKFIGIEKDPAIFRTAKDRFTNPGAFVGRRPVAVSDEQLALLGAV